MILMRLKRARHRSWPILRLVTSPAVGPCQERAAAPPAQPASQPASHPSIRAVSCVCRVRAPFSPSLLTITITADITITVVYAQHGYAQHGGPQHGGLQRA